MNCLVLDEPTNHLDLEAIEQLEAALEAFDGTLLLVTHDRAFLEAVQVTRTIDVGDPQPRPSERAGPPAGGGEAGRRRAPAPGRCRGVCTA